MPELPEVETVRRGLAATVVGRRLGPVVVTGARTVRRTSGDAVVAGLCGQDHRLGRSDGASTSCSRSTRASCS